MSINVNLRVEPMHINEWTWGPGKGQKLKQFFTLGDFQI